MAAKSPCKPDAAIFMLMSTIAQPAIVGGRTGSLCEISAGRHHLDIDTPQTGLLNVSQSDSLPLS